MRAIWYLLAGWLGLSCGSAAAHFNMLLPQSASAKKGETQSILYQWGHPFEHQLFDAPQPQSLIVRAPDGKRLDLTDKLEKTSRKTGDKDTTVFQLRFTPELRGDYVFLLRTPPIWMEEEGEFFEDTVKTVLHVQVQKGWDTTEDEFELAPLTRPYGLQPAMTYQARIALRRGESLGDLSLVEIEHYNGTPPKQLPADEQITRSVKLDPNGVATTTLTEAGWWSLTVSRRKGTRMREGKSYPVRQRSTLWVFVDEPARGE